MAVKIYTTLDNFNLEIKDVRKHLESGEAIAIYEEALATADATQIGYLTGLVDRPKDLVSHSKRMAYFRAQAQTLKEFDSKKYDKDFNRVFVFESLDNLKSKDNYTPLYKEDITQMLLDRKHFGMINFKYDLGYINQDTAEKIVKANTINISKALTNPEELVRTRYIKYNGEVPERVYSAEEADEVVENTYYKNFSLCEFTVEISSKYLKADVLNNLYKKIRGNYTFYLNGKPVTRPAKEKSEEINLDKTLRNRGTSGLATWHITQAIARWLTDMPELVIEDEVVQHYQFTTTINNRPMYGPIEDRCGVAEKSVTLSVDIIKDFFPLHMSKETYVDICQQLVAELDSTINKNKKCKVKLTLNRDKANNLYLAFEKEGRFIEVTSLNKSNSEGKELIDQVPDLQDNGGAE